LLHRTWQSHAGKLRRQTFQRQIINIFIHHYCLLVGESSNLKKENNLKLSDRFSHNNIFLSLFFLRFLCHKNFPAGRGINFREIHQARISGRKLRKNLHLTRVGLQLFW